LAAAAIDDFASPGCFHAGAEANRFFAAKFAGLICAFHVFSSDAKIKFKF
jgi:hypothetical protein